MSSTKIVCVTGAAGRIAYAFIPLVCSGQVFGKDTRIDLRLLDIEMSAEKLRGVALEINDCCYPLVNSLVATTDSQEAFQDCQVAVLLGGFPRMAGMERKDLTARNAKGMRTQGMALEQYASKDVKVLVVANPANTNALVAMQCAPSIPRGNFTCLTRLDHERLRYFVAEYVNAARTAGNVAPDAPPTRPEDVSGVAIWGNHSSTQVPFIDMASVRIRDRAYNVLELLQTHKGGSVVEELVARVQQRGAEIIKAQGASSGMSAAEAISKHLQDWLDNGQANKDKDAVFSMGVYSNGNPYGVPDQLVYSFPVRQISAGVVEIVPGLTVSDRVQLQLDTTTAELCAERGDAEEAIKDTDTDMARLGESKL